MRTLCTVLGSHNFRHFCLIMALLKCVCVQLKQMEVQLEEEYDDKQRVLKEKRELESKLIAAQEQVLTQSTQCSTVPFNTHNTYTKQTTQHYQTLSTHNKM